MTDAVRWIDLCEPDRDALMAAAPRAEDLHPRALDQLLEPARHDDEPRPTLESHGDYVFGVFLVPVAEQGSDELYYQEIDLVLNRAVVLTVRKRPERGKPFEWEDAKEVYERGDLHSTAMVAYHLVDDVAERFLDLTDVLNDAIDDMEDHVDAWPNERTRGRLSSLRHDLLHIRRTLAPTRDAVRRVVDNRIELDGEELFDRDVELHFADAYDKLLRASEALELSRDLVAGVRDYHQSKIANDQNEVMKTLTVIASVLLVPTFIVGLYGQNFHDIPELRWSFGYGWSWGLIIVLTALQLWYFRRKRWI